MPPLRKNVRRASDSPSSEQSPPSEMSTLCSASARCSLTSSSKDETGCNPFASSKNLNAWNPSQGTSGAGGACAHAFCRETSKQEARVIKKQSQRSLLMKGPPRREAPAHDVRRSTLPFPACASPEHSAPFRTATPDARPPGSCPPCCRYPDPPVDPQYAGDSRIAQRVRGEETRDTRSRAPGLPVTA